MVRDFPSGDLLTTPSEALGHSMLYPFVECLVPPADSNPMRAGGPERLAEFMSPSAHVKWNSIC